ncbi:MAG: response regulator transcription factor [Nitrosopumilus sp.]|nr:response regulator transcription factor [Nitrosopumilus sp.]
MSKGRSSNKTVSERREKVMVLLTKGLKGYQIAKELDISESTVSRSIKSLERESIDNLNSFAKKMLPFWYQTSIEGIRNILNECWHIYSNKGNDEEITWMNKLNALKLAKECNESMFKLVSDGPSIIYLKELEGEIRKH